MKERWLVLWAGTDAQWGRLDEGDAFGPNVESGQVSCLLAVTGSGYRGLRRVEDLVDQEILVDVTAELDLHSRCRVGGAVETPPLNLVAASPPGSARALTIPALPTLLSGASEHVLSQLTGACGTLAVPDAWRGHPGSESLLSPWTKAGWAIASWESTVGPSAKGARVIALAADGWARVAEPTFAVLLPQGPEAAAASAAAPLLWRALRAALEATYGEVVGECDPGSWLTVMRIRRLVSEALGRRQESVVIGGAGAPVLTFPSGTPSSQQQALAHARACINLQRLTDTDWWAELSRPGAVSTFDGGSVSHALDWAAKPSIFLGTRAAEKRLQLSFRMNGHPASVDSPPMLPMFGVGASETSPAQPAAPRPAATSLPLPPAIAVADLDLALASYQAGTFVLTGGHRGLRVLVDERPTPVRLLDGAAGKAAAKYTVQATGVRQAAVVRVDYELEAKA